MSDLKSLLQEKIKENRPKLSTSSMRTYISILSNLYKKLNGEGNIEWFHKEGDEILKYLDNKNDQTRKTTLSALFVLTNMKEYQTVMNTIMKKVNDDYKDQKMNAKQKDNWISIDEIKEKYNVLSADANLMLRKKKILNENVMMEFLLMSCLSGVIMPPRRSLDYSDMKIRNYDVKTDNYYKANKFYFNKYKTFKTYGLQILDVPKELNVVLKKWIKINTNDYMIYSSNGNKLSCPQITRILNKIFGKNISTSMLRHIYLTNVYKDVPQINKMENLANEMGHSVSTAMEYIKR